MEITPSSFETPIIQRIANSTPVQNQKRQKIHRFHISYETPEGIVWEEVVNFHKFQAFVTGKINSYRIKFEYSPRYPPIHPVITLEDISRATARNNIFTQDCLLSMLRQENKYSLFFLRCVKVDGTPQGLPVTNLYACRDYKSQQDKNISPVNINFLWIIFLFFCAGTEI